MCKPNLSCFIPPASAQGICAISSVAGAEGTANDTADAAVETAEEPINEVLNTEVKKVYKDPAQFYADLSK